MNQVEVEQKNYQMPPQDGFTIADFLRSRTSTIGSILRNGLRGSHSDQRPAGVHIQIANMWLIVNVGGGPTPRQTSVTLSVPADPNSVSSFTNIRVANVQASYELWRSRGAEFITEPKEQYGETCCYLRDPDELPYRSRPKQAGSRQGRDGPNGSLTGH